MHVLHTMQATEDLHMSDEKKIKTELVFMPGCFDDFEGTQEELNEMVAEIQRMVDSGEIHERGQPIDLEAAFGDLTDEDLNNLINELDSNQKRTLQ